MPNYARALADIRAYQEASIGQRRGGIESRGLLGLHGIDEMRELKRALEKQERAQKAMQRRRGKGRLIGTALGMGAGLINPLLGAGVAGLLSYGGQKVATRSGVRAKRIGSGKFYTEQRATANRALRDWMRDYKMSQITGALTDAFSAYQLGKLTGGEIPGINIKKKLSSMYFGY